MVCHIGFNFTGCISGSEFEKIWHDNNGPDSKSLRGNRMMKMRDGRHIQNKTLGEDAAKGVIGIQKK